MAIEVSSAVIETLLAEAHAAAPNECCGLLFGEEDRIEVAAPTRNVHSDPESHFEIDPKALIDAHRDARSGGIRLTGYYHSHPNGLAEPSATDRAMADADGLIWAIVAAGREIGRAHV